MQQKENKQTIQSIIAQVVKINEKYEEIQKIKGENFNIFSILKLERNEVQTHSNFIYELLNPEGSHNQKTLFVELFLKNISSLEDYGDIKNVYQEYVTSLNRKIDLVIETEKYQIGIEMKIDARDQEKQLYDYKKELDKSNKEAKLYYLTLTGHEASEKSTNNELKVNHDYFLLSFEENIYNWLEDCIEKSATIPLLREGLVHYKNLIAKITNKISAPVEKEMEEVIHTPEQVEAAQIILNAYPKIWAKKEMEFWYKLKKELNGINTIKYLLADQYSVFFDDKENELSEEKAIERIENLRNKKYEYVGFALEKEHENKTSTYLSICQGGNDSISFYLSFYGENGERLAINPALNSVCENINFRGIWDKDERYKIIDERIIFYGRYQTKPTYDLFDKMIFNELIDKVTKEVKNTINLIEQNEKAIIDAINS